MKFHTVESDMCNVHIVLDETSPVEWAMAGAMFSRSSEGILAIAEKVDREKAESFIKKYYVGYSHASIGDLVDVKLFVEDVPFYIAAMLEHHSLFRGQESSTRYINFATQRPAFTADKKVYAEQIEFYQKALNKVTENLLNKANLDGLDKPAKMTHTRALAARAFDICRSLLPLGATTNVAWFGSVKVIKEHLAYMQTLGVPYNSYATFILNSLREVFPESVEATPRPSQPWVFDDADHALVGDLDFGSWRDLNRHRVGRHTFRLPTPDSPLNPWYEAMLIEHEIDIPRPKHILNPVAQTDALLLGQQIENVEYILPNRQLRYVAKLRTGLSVHPTLRIFMQNILKYSQNITYDSTPDIGAFAYYIHRGNETITVRT